MRIGVLIVGSLFRKQDEIRIRAAWRSNRLDLASVTHVDAPIRYGRRSQGWGDTFTMILDSAAPNGRALLASGKTDVRSLGDLLDEARWLWSAEDNKPLSDRFYRNWGCVAALFGPKAIAAGFPEQWRRDFQAANPPFHVL